MKINKAVIPIAGKGTRFLPASKQIPKEMIPIINIPMIHYPVLEALESGIEQVIFVNSCGKHSIEDYFDRNWELENFLQQRGKEELCEKIRSIGRMIEIISVRQKEQLGLGHALNCARNIVGEETFVVILGDDIVRARPPVARQLMEVSQLHGGKSVVGVMSIDPSETDQYGIVEGEFLQDSGKTLKMARMVEKPRPKDAPSDLATPGRYVLSPEIFECLEEIPRGVGGEYQLTDAINKLAQRDCVYAHIFEGERFDTGSLGGYLEATVDFALADGAIRPTMEKIIREKVKKYHLSL